MPLIESRAIILRTYKLAEADKIAVMLTPDAGLVRGVAKGARKLTSRFGAALEPYTLMTVEYFEKEGRDLVSVRRAEIIKSYFNLVGREDVYQGLEYLSEITIEFVPPQEPNPLIFRMVSACLEIIEKIPEQTALILRYFEIWILKLGGFLPDLRRCSHCSLVFEEDDKTFFRWGEPVLCQACARAYGAVRELPVKVRQIVNDTLKLSPENFTKKYAPDRESWLNTLTHWTHDLISRTLERPLRSSVR